MDGGNRTITRTVKQYSSASIPDEDFNTLHKIAKRYQAVKNIIFDRYGGVRGLEKIYGLNDIQNELLTAGIRDELKIPSVYYQMASREAIANIRAAWELTKKKVTRAARKNQGFSESDRHYLYFLLKVDQAFAAVNNRNEIRLKKSLQETYEELASEVEIKHLDNYLRRQVRKYHSKPYAKSDSIFAVDRRGYDYGDHTIHLASGRKRLRISIPLTDNRRFERQISVRLIPEKNGVVIYAPIEVRVRQRKGYGRPIGLSTGLYTMLVTSDGHEYGTQMGKYQTEYSDWLRDESKKYSRNKIANPGREKYRTKKNRLEERLHSYIGRELNRMLNEEQPEAVYLPGMPRLQSSSYSKKHNYRMTSWQFRYVIHHLEMRCAERGIEFREVFGGGIGNTCSRCGAENAKKLPGVFVCSICGYKEKSRINTARNALARGMAER